MKHEHEIKSRHLACNVASTQRRLCLLAQQNLKLVLEIMGVMITVINFLCLPKLSTSGFLPEVERL